MGAGTPERIDVRKLIVDEPKPESVRFDPNEEISDLEFDSILDWLNLNKTSGPNIIYPNGAYHLAVLFPHRADELKLDDKSQAIVDRYLFDTIGGWEFLQAIRNRRILFPKIKPPFTSEPTLPELVEELRKEPWDAEMLFAAACLKIAYPEAVEELGLTRAGFTNLKEKFKGSSASGRLLSSLRILFPDLPKSEFCTEQQLKEIKRKLEVTRHIPLMWGWQRDLQESYELFILAADKVEIDEGGIRITPRALDLEAEINDVPEIRRF